MRLKEANEKKYDAMKTEICVQMKGLSILKHKFHLDVENEGKAQGQRLRKLARRKSSHRVKRHTSFQIIKFGEKFEEMCRSEVSEAKNNYHTE